jgi:hypothetical protein
LCDVVKTTGQLYLPTGSVYRQDRDNRAADPKRMNINSTYSVVEDPSDTRPILIVPYMWIGDFVRGHTVVRVLKQRWPNRPVDLLTTSLCAPLVDYMPGVRSRSARSGRHPRTGGLRRRSPFRDDQPLALG